MNVSAESIYYSDSCEHILEALTGYVSDVEKSGKSEDTYNAVLEKVQYIIDNTTDIQKLNEYKKKIVDEYVTYVKNFVSNNDDEFSSIKLLKNTISRISEESELDSLLTEIENQYVSDIKTQIEDYLSNYEISEAKSLLKEAKELVGDNVELDQVEAEVEAVKVYHLDDLAISNSEDFTDLSDSSSIWIDNEGNQYDSNTSSGMILSSAFYSTGKVTFSVPDDAKTLVFSYARIAQELWSESTSSTFDDTEGHYLLLEDQDGNELVGQIDLDEYTQVGTITVDVSDASFITFKSKGGFGIFKALIFDIQLFS